MDANGTLYSHPLASIRGWVSFVLGGCLLTANEHEWTLTGSHLFAFISAHSWLGLPLFLGLPSNREETSMDANRIPFIRVH
jgi:hypothetical protein